jgi:hypothetical protein
MRSNSDHRARLLGILGSAIGSLAVIGTAGAAPVELGGMVGEPTGLSAKFWTTENTALTAAAAWSFVDDEAFHFHADVTTHDFGLFQVDKGELGLYYGLGGRILVEEDDDDRFGFRVPVGLAYLFENAPVTLFGEVAPLLDVAPETDFTMNGALGVRFVLR